MNSRPYRKHAARRRARGGMTLFEVMLALAIFSMAALGLVEAINQIGAATLESRQIREIEQTMESIIDEYSKSPLLQETDKEIKAGKDGVSYHVRVKEEKDLRNQEGRVLQGIFRIHVIARWTEGGAVTEMENDTLRYAGIFQPAG